ncbi:hypothetical protein WG954_11980 [Lacibacter sp. H375]|uniref:hypothetical protein n=1 Tax=Lacibacter sp. H375 TaxID=3133424 RepID=UPI0030BDB4E5
MKTKFNYITYFLLCGILSVFLLLPYYVIKHLSLLIANESNLTAMYFGLSVAALGIIYGIIVLLDLLIYHRFGFYLKNDALFITDVFYLQKREIPLYLIKGYYIDTYVYSWMFKAIVVETYDGHRFRALNLFLWNFRRVKKKLPDSGIKKLLN